MANTVLLALYSQVSQNVNVYETAILCQALWYALNATSLSAALGCTMFLLTSHCLLIRAQIPQLVTKSHWFSSLAMLFLYLPALGL